MTGVDGQRDRGVGPTRTDSSSSPTHHPMRPSPAGDLSRRSEEGGGTRFRRLGRRQQCRGHRPPTGLVRRTVSARSHRLWGRIRFARFRPARGDQGLTGGARTPAGCGPEGAESSGCRQPSGSCRSREAHGSPHPPKHMASAGTLSGLSTATSWSEPTAASSTSRRCRLQGRWATSRRIRRWSPSRRCQRVDGSATDAANVRVGSGHVWRPTRGGGAQPAAKLTAPVNQESL
jgi:hypothetical protein